MNVEEEVDRTLMQILGAFPRKISNEWLVPAKGRAYFNDLRRVFYRDGSPEGLYPTCIVTKDLIDQVVIIMPILKFQKLLEVWKKANETYVENVRKIVREQRKDRRKGATLMICYFPEGYVVHYLKGNAKHYILSRSGETVYIDWDFKHVRTKHLNIKYSTWFKRLGEKEVKA